MTLDAPRLTVATEGQLRDELSTAPVSHSELLLQGHAFGVRRDEVLLPSGPATRDVVTHPGSVLVVALMAFDGVDHLLLLQQYRHPVGALLWELPAGLLDIAGEPAHEAAARELAEETDLQAASWHVLIDLFSSPGASAEAARVYLARDLTSIPTPARYVRTAEEADFAYRWVPLELAETAVLQGRLHNAGAVAGILAASASRRGGYASLRPADAPWPEHRDAP